MAAAPDDPERIFTHAQSEFRIGFYDYMRHQYRDARPHFLSYEHLAERMVSLAPKNPRYLRELSYAEGDLCTLALSKPEDPPAAVRLCGKALAHMKEAAREEPGARPRRVDISDKESWMGSAFHAVGDNGRALQHWQIQERCSKASWRPIRKMRNAAANGSPCSATWRAWTPVPVAGIWRRPGFAARPRGSMR